jgi:sec-independent protein translocase protein TatA
MGIGIWQLLLFLAVVLLLFGATRLPMLARSLGQSITEFKKGMKELEDQSSDKSDR